MRVGDGGGSFNDGASSYLYVSVSVHRPQGVTPAFLLMRGRGRQRWMLPGGGQVERQIKHEDVFYPGPSCSCFCVRAERAVTYKGLRVKLKENKVTFEPGSSRMSSPNEQPRYEMVRVATERRPDLLPPGGTHTHTSSS